MFIRVYDNGGKTVDRYTLVIQNPDLPGSVDMYGFNEQPFHPQGFGQYAGDYVKMGSYAHLGKPVSIESLPTDAKKFARQTIGEYEALSPAKKKSPKSKTHRSKSRRSSPGISLGGMR